MRRRLKFIEQRLFWDGSVNCHDISEASTPLAFADFARNHEIASLDAKYDHSRKGYVRGPACTLAQGKPDPSGYFVHLRLIGDSSVEFPMPGLPFVPDFDLALLSRADVLDVFAESQDA